MGANHVMNLSQLHCLSYEIAFFIQQIDPSAPYLFDVLNDHTTLFSKFGCAFVKPPTTFSYSGPPVHVTPEPLFTQQAITPPSQHKLNCNRYPCSYPLSVLKLNKPNILSYLRLVDDVKINLYLLRTKTTQDIVDILKWIFPSHI